MALGDYPENSYQRLLPINFLLRSKPSQRGSFNSLSIPLLINLDYVIQKPKSTKQTLEELVVFLFSMAGLLI